VEPAGWSQAHWCVTDLGSEWGISVPSRPPSAVDAPEGFDTFYDREFEWARRLAFVLTGDVHAADEIAQESFARLFPRFGSLQNPRAYLRVVIVNLHRREARRRHRGVSMEPAHDLGSDHESVELLASIDRLPARQRAVIVLRYFEGCSEAEIADALSCAPGTVKSLASRALERLRKDIDS
jgi:RNA polymerase sigma factor (sigma-70 family)